MWVYYKQGWKNLGLFKKRFRFYLHSVTCMWRKQTTLPWWRRLRNSPQLLQLLSDEDVIESRASFPTFADSSRHFRHQSFPLVRLQHLQRTSSDRWVHFDMQFVKLFHDERSSNRVRNYGSHRRYDRLNSSLKFADIILYQKSPWDICSLLQCYFH